MSAGQPGPLGRRLDGPLAVGVLKFENSEVTCRGLVRQQLSSGGGSDFSRRETLRLDSLTATIAAQLPAVVLVVTRFLELQHCLLQH